MSAPDLELEELFAGEPELAEVARILRAARPEPVVDPDFQPVLRTRLLARAAEQMARGGRPSWWRRPMTLAWAAPAAVAAAAAATVVLTIINSHPNDRVTLVTASSPLAGQAAVTADEITVAFDRPMDQGAVVAGLRIEPATEVRTSWTGDQLIIDPVHHLAPNTPYLVTIDQKAARARSGGRVKGGVRIAFGTAPAPGQAPGATPAPVPALDVTPLGPVADAAGGILFAPDGSLAATHGLVQAPAEASPSPSPISSPSPTSTPSPSPSPSPSPNPSPSPSPSSSPAPSPSPSPASGSGVTPSPVPTPTPAASPTPGSIPSPAPAVSVRPLQPALVRFDGGGQRRLGDAASAAAYAPDGAHLAWAVPRAGGADILVGEAGSAPGSAPGSVIARSDTADTGIGWADAGRVVFVSARQINAVDLHGNVQSLAAVAPGATVALAPGGQHAFTGPAAENPGSGALLSLPGGTVRELRASRTVAAFSAGGRYVAWSTGSAISVSPVDRDLTVSVPVAASGPVSEVAVSDDGRRVAYLAGTTAVVAQLPSGRTLATGAGVARLVLTGAGDRLGLIVTRAPGSHSAATARVPSGGRAAPVAASISPVAEAVLNRFLGAQVRGDTATLLELARGERGLAAQTPAGLTRSRVVSASSNRDGSVTSMVRLITDGSPEHPASVWDEAVVIRRNGPDAFSLGSVSIGPRHDQPPGPHVVFAGPAQPGSTLLLVTFDSDLNAGSVPGALSLLTPEGQPVAAAGTYTPDTRSVLLAIPPADAGRALQLTIGTSLTDINGQHLQVPFTVVLS